MDKLKVRKNLMPQKTAQPPPLKKQLKVQDTRIEALFRADAHCAQPRMIVSRTQNIATRNAMRIGREMITKRSLVIIHLFIVV